MKFLTETDFSRNELKNAVAHNLSAPPSNPKEGQYYYDFYQKKFKGFNGLEWEDFGGADDLVSSIRKKLTVSIADEDNSTDTEFLIVHNFGREYLLVNCYETSTKEQVMTNVVLVNPNETKVSFEVPPRKNQYTIVLLG